MCKKLWKKAIKFSLRKEEKVEFGFELICVLIIKFY